MNIFRKTLFIIICLGIMNFSTVFAGGIDHFEVKFSPEEAKVGESIDLTIEAVDKNNIVVDDYDGTVVIFSETDPEVELPNILEDNTYTFLASDQGKIKFENAVIFKNEGEQELSVYDLDDDTVLGIGEVSITKQEEVIENIDIEILSPENGLTIGEKSIKISGNSQKNHTIKIIVNNTQEISTITNDEGLFEKTIENLEDGENTFKAQVLNADSIIIGESKEVKINVNSNLPTLKDIKVTPTEVDTEGSFEIKIISNEGLTEVNVVINDVLTKLEENSEKNGIYLANLYAPSEEGNYKIDVILKDELGHEVKELGAGNLVVKKIELNVAKPEIIETKIIEEKKQETKITGLKVIELKSKSVLTWNKLDGAQGYNVYKKLNDGTIELVKKVNEAKFEIEFDGDEIKYEYFAIKPILKADNGETFEGDLSEATKIKTGPEVLILLLLSLFIGGLIFITNRKKA